MIRKKKGVKGASNCREGARERKKKKKLGGTRKNL